MHWLPKNVFIYFYVFQQWFLIIIKINERLPEKWLLEVLHSFENDSCLVAWLLIFIKTTTYVLTRVADAKLIQHAVESFL